MRSLAAIARSHDAGSLAGAVKHRCSRTPGVRINREEKTVDVKNLLDGITYTERYDKLVLSPGAKARMLPIEGIESVPVFALLVADAKGIRDSVVDNDLKDTVVIEAVLSV